MKKILIAVDFSDIANTAVEQASMIALATNAEITIMYVAPPDPDYIGFKSMNKNERNELADVLQKEHHQLQDIAHRLNSQGIQAKALLVQGEPIDTILQEAKKINCNLIVMGSHGFSGITRALLGSVSEGVLRKSTLPLLIVPYKLEPQ